MIIMKKRTAYGFGVLTILGILILSNTASACVNPTDSFATEVLLNKPGVSYNLSGMIEADNVIVKTKEVPVESEKVDGVPTPQAIMIPESNSTVTMEAVMTEKPVETRTELDRIIYRSHYNPDVAVILSEDCVYGRTMGREEAPFCQNPESNRRCAQKCAVHQNRTDRRRERCHARYQCFR